MLCSHGAVPLAASSCRQQRAGTGGKKYRRAQPAHGNTHTQRGNHSKRHAPAPGTRKGCRRSEAPPAARQCRPCPAPAPPCRSSPSPSSCTHTQPQTSTPFNILCAPVWSRQSVEQGASPLNARPHQPPCCASMPAKLHTHTGFAAACAFRRIELLASRAASACFASAQPVRALQVRWKGSTRLYGSLSSLRSSTMRPTISEQPTCGQCLVTCIAVLLIEGDTTGCGCQEADTMRPRGPRMVSVRSHSLKQVVQAVAS